MATNLTIQPCTADTFVNQAAPTTPNGSELLVTLFDGAATSVIRILLRFDLSSIPDDAIVSAATMSLYLYEYYSVFDGAKEIQCKRVTSAWTESTVTWNTQPTVTATVNPTATTIHATLGWVNWNVLALVQDARVNRSDSLDLRLSFTTESGSLSIPRFYSREYTTNPLLCPKLDLTYTTSDQHKYSGNPILSGYGTGWESRGVRQPTIYTEAGTHYVYYCGTGHADNYIPWTCGLATGSDLVSLTRQGQKLTEGVRRLAGEVATPTGYNGTGNVVYTKFTSPHYSQGAATKFYFNCKGTGHAKFAVFNDSSNSPGTLVWSSDEIDVVAGWQSIDCTGITILRDTPYWLGWISASVADTMGYRTVTGLRKYKAATYVGFSFASSPTGLSGDTANVDSLALWSGTPKTLNVDDWDALLANFETIVKSGDTYYGFYTGGNVMADGGGEIDIPGAPYSTGIATASSISGPWTKYANNPIFGGTGGEIGRAHV